MPLPKTKNVGTVIEFLKQDKPGMSYDQMIAIALSHTGKSKKKKKVPKKKYSNKQIEKAVKKKLAGR